MTSEASGERPDPLVPPEVDLRDFGYMPLDVLRLRDSDLATLATGEQFKAAVLLWCAAWHQVPAASLPSDDRLLAKYSGAGTRWGRVKDMALRGFIECSDGRLYHPVIAEKALEAVGRRGEFADRKENERERQRRHREVRKRLFAELRTRGVTAEWDASTEHLRALLADLPVTPLGTLDHGPVTPPVTQPVTDPQRLGRERKGRERKGSSSGTIVPSGPEERLSLEIQGTVDARARTNGVETWAAYSAAYRGRYGVDPVRNAQVNAQLAMLVKKLGAEEAPAVAAFYVGHQAQFYVAKGHAVGPLVADAEKLRTEWATGRQVTSTQARQADRSQATFNAFAPLLEEAGGGKPE